MLRKRVGLARVIAAEYPQPVHRCACVVGVAADWCEQNWQLLPNRVVIDLYGEWTPVTSGSRGRECSVNQLDDLSRREDCRGRQHVDELLAAPRVATEEVD